MSKHSDLLHPVVAVEKVVVHMADGAQHELPVGNHRISVRTDGQRYYMLVDTGVDFGSNALGRFKRTWAKMVQQNEVAERTPVVHSYKRHLWDYHSRVRTDHPYYYGFSCKRVGCLWVCRLYGSKFASREFNTFGPWIRGRTPPCEGNRRDKSNH